MYFTGTESWNQLINFKGTIMECPVLKISFPGMVNNFLTTCCSQNKYSSQHKSDCSCQPEIMSRSRVCNFSFLWFLTCLSTGRVSGQGRPGQEVVTFLPQGDILYEIFTVYTNQNTEPIITALWPIKSYLKLKCFNCWSVNVELICLFHWWLECNNECLYDNQHSPYPL